MSNCNYCKLKRFKQRAKEKGRKIVLRPSNFMNGSNVFEISKGEKIPEYIEPCNKYPNGDEWFESHQIAWMMTIGEHCEC